METWRASLKLAVRRLRRDPGFTAVVVAILALGIGFNAAMLGLLQTVILADLPWRDSEQLVMVWNHTEGREELALSEPELRDYRERSRTLESLGAYRSGGANLAIGDRRLGLWITRASPGLFSTLGAEASAGRLFLPEEYEPGNDRVAVLSHELWTDAFGADPSVLGTRILLNGESHSVVGVMPPSYPAPTDFRWVGHAELWLPLSVSAARPRPRSERDLWVVGRLADGVSVEQARAELATLQDELERSSADDYRGETGWGLRLVPVEDEVLGRIRPVVLLFVAAVGLLLLLVCANVANLFMARLDRRHRELALRTALGAGRRGLVWEILTESLLLSLAAGALALLVLAWGVEALHVIGPGNVPRIDQVSLDAPVVLFGIVTAVVTSVLFGLGPALQVASVAPSGALRAASSSVDPAKLRARSVLLAMEVSIAVVLLVAAGLLLRSLERLHRVDPGFDVERLVTADLMLYGDAYEDDHDALAFFDAVVERLQLEREVRSVGLTNSVPFWNPGSLVNRHPVEAESVPETLGEPLGAVWESVSADLLETTGVSLVRGRHLQSSDREDAPGVVVVSQSLAAVLWPGRSPVGERIRRKAPGSPWLRIVGVSEDVRDAALELPPLPRVYLPLRQTAKTFGAAPRYAALMIRSRGPALPVFDVVRDALRELDPTLPLANPRAMATHLSDSTTRYRLSATLLSLFAVVAVLLAGLGLYGVVSYVAGRRTLEIGIRIALGARERDILRMLARQALAVTAIGIAAGMVGALAVSGSLEGLLFGVVPLDASTYAAVTLFVLAISMFATYVPARRASRMEVTRSLKES